MLARRSAATCSSVCSHSSVAAAQKSSPSPLNVAIADSGWARRIAVAGSAHPPSTSHRMLEDAAASRCGLNTYTGPLLARTAAVSSYRSPRVLVTTAGPGWRAMISASVPVFPARGGAIYRTCSSTGTRRACP